MSFAARSIRVNFADNVNAFVHSFLAYLLGITFTITISSAESFFNLSRMYVSSSHASITVSAVASCGPVSSNVSGSESGPVSSNEEGDHPPGPIEDACPHPPGVLF